MPVKNLIMVEQCFYIYQNFVIFVLKQKQKKLSFFVKFILQ